MRDRPAIGTRVVLRGNSGLKVPDGRGATVIAHHVDGVAFVVRVDGGRDLTCDPCQVELEAAHA